MVDACVLPRSHLISMNAIVVTPWLLRFRRCSRSPGSISRPRFEDEPRRPDLACI